MSRRVGSVRRHIRPLTRSRRNKRPKVSQVTKEVIEEWPIEYPEKNVPTAEEEAVYEEMRAAAMEKWGPALSPDALFTPKDEVHRTRIRSCLMHIVSKHASIYQSVILGWSNIPKEIQEILGYWIIERGPQGTYAITNMRINAPGRGMPKSAVEAIHTNQTYRYGTEIEVTRVYLRDEWDYMHDLWVAGNIDDAVFDNRDSGAAILEYAELFERGYGDDESMLAVGYAHRIYQSMTLSEYVIPIGAGGSNYEDFVDVPIMVGSPRDTAPSHVLGSQIARGYFVVQGPKNATVRTIPTKLVRARHTIRTFPDPDTEFPVARIVYVGGAYGHTATTVTRVVAPAKNVQTSGVGKPIQSFIPGETSECIVGQLQAYRIKKMGGENDTPLPLRYPLLIVLAVFHEFWTASVETEENDEVFDPFEYAWNITEAKVHKAHKDLLQYLVVHASQEYAKSCQRALKITLEASLEALPQNGGKYYGYPIIGYRTATSKAKKELYEHLFNRISILSEYAITEDFDNVEQWKDAYPKKKPPSLFPHTESRVIDTTHPHYDQEVAKYVLGRASTIVFGGPLDNQPLSDFYEGAKHTMHALAHQYMRVAVGKFPYENAEHWARRTCESVPKMVTDSLKVEYMMWLRRNDGGTDVPFHENLRDFVRNTQSIVDTGSADRWGKIDTPEDKADKATSSALGSAVSIPAIMHYIGAVYGAFIAASSEIKSRVDDPSQVPFIDTLGTPGDTDHGGLIRLVAELTHYTQYHNASKIRKTLLGILEPFEDAVPQYDSDYDLPPKPPALIRKRKRRIRSRRRPVQSEESDSNSDIGVVDSDEETNMPDIVLSSRPSLFLVTINHQMVWKRIYDEESTAAIIRLLWWHKSMRAGKLPFDVSITRDGNTVNVQCTQGRLSTACLRTKRYYVTGRPKPAKRHIVDSFGQRVPLTSGAGSLASKGFAAEGFTAEAGASDSPDAEEAFVDTGNSFEPSGTVAWADLPPHLRSEIDPDGTIGSMIPAAYDYVREHLLEPQDDPNERRSVLQIMADFDYGRLLTEGWLVWVCAEEMQETKYKPADDWTDTLSPHWFVLVSPSQAFSPQTNMTIGYNNIQGTRGSYAATTRKGTLGGPNLLTNTGYQKKSMVLCNSFSEVIQAPGLYAMGTNMNADTNYARGVLGSWKLAQIEDCTTISESMMRSGICATALIETVTARLEHTDQESFLLPRFYSNTRDDVYKTYRDQHPHLIKYPHGVTAAKVGTVTKTGMPLIMKYSQFASTLSGVVVKVPHYTFGVVDAITISRGVATGRDNLAGGYIPLVVKARITTPRDAFEGEKCTTPAAQKAVMGAVAPDVLFPHVDGHPLHMMFGSNGEASRNTSSRMLRGVCLAVAAAIGDKLYVDGFCALRMANDPVLAAFLVRTGVNLRKTLRDSKGVAMGTAGVYFQQLNVTSHHADSKFQATAADEVPLDGKDPGSRNNRKGRYTGYSRVSMHDQVASMFPSHPDELRAFLGALITPEITNKHYYPICIPCQSLGYVKVVYESNEGRTTYQVRCPKCGGYSEYTSKFTHDHSSTGAQFGKVALRHTLVQASNYVRGMGVEYRYKFALHQFAKERTYNKLPKVI